MTLVMSPLNDPPVYKLNPGKPVIIDTPFYMSPVIYPEQQRSEEPDQKKEQ